MHHHIIETATIAIALLLSASLACAAQKKSVTPGATAAGVTASEKSAKDRELAAHAASKAAAPVKLVNINSASKAELMTLPGIGDALADRIIAGRPYNTKAHLVAKEILSVELWDNIRTLITARQK